MITNKLTMGIEEVASELNITTQTLRNRKSANDDIPPARKFGKKLIWLRKDVEKWLDNLPLAA